MIQNSSVQDWITGRILLNAVFLFCVMFSWKNSTDLMAFRVMSISFIFSFNVQITVDLQGYPAYMLQFSKNNELCAVTLMCFFDSAWYFDYLFWSCCVGLIDGICRYVVVKVHNSWAEFQDYFRKQVFPFLGDDLQRAPLMCPLSHLLFLAFCCRMVRKDCWHSPNEGLIYILWVSHPYVPRSYDFQILSYKEM